MVASLALSWWRLQIETFSALLAICAENSPVPAESPTQRPVTRSFDVFFDLHPNKRLSKQRWGWWFETPLCPLWRHRHGANCVHMQSVYIYVFRCTVCYWLIDRTAYRYEKKPETRTLEEVYSETTSYNLNQWCNIVDSTLRNKRHWNINRISNILIQENAFECVVCEMATILSRPQCVKQGNRVVLQYTNMLCFWSVSYSFYLYPLLLIPGCSGVFVNLVGGKDLCCSSFYFQSYFDASLKIWTNESHESTKNY